MFNAHACTYNRRKNTVREQSVLVLPLYVNMEIAHITYHLHNVRYMQPVTLRRGARATYATVTVTSFFFALVTAFSSFYKNAANVTSRKYTRTKQTHDVCDRGFT